MKLIRTAAVVLAIILPGWGGLAQQINPKPATGAQVSSEASTQKVVVVTGARFSYKLVEKWIDEYSKVNPHVQIIVEARGSADPLKYDILAEVYNHDEALRQTRQYVNIARYAILPVATAGSDFAKAYSERGLNTDAIKQIFFHNIFVEGRTRTIEAPFSVYTRLQKAGVPMVFAKYFGQDQKDIKGTAIAGADAHLVKALLRDSVGVTYLPLPLVFDENTRKPVEGLTVLPVDLNGNKKVNEDEKFYGDLDQVLDRLEALEPREIHNIPIEYLHLSVDKKTGSPEAIDFLKWVNENGQGDLHAFGYLKPGSKESANNNFREFTSKQGK